MTPTQNEKAERFRTLHAGPETFVIPNPWDAGTARMLTALGFPALATTSAGFAFSVGRRDGDGAVTRDETLAHARAIVLASDLPVSADLENGFGDEAESVAETIRRAGAVGLVGTIVAGLLSGWAFAALIGWDVAAVVQLVWTWVTIWPMNPERTALMAAREDPSRASVSR